MGPSLIFYLGIAGLALNVLGALVLALADSWFSRAVLVHLDALESNLAILIDALRNKTSQFVDSAGDLGRDRGQDRARFVKLLGWVILFAGFVVNLVVFLLVNPRP